jgi:mono/diheme cytochrome c family protein
MPMLRNAVAAAFALLLVSGGHSRAQGMNFPEFSPEAWQGGALFMGKCASCHGAFAQGTDKGPPLVHKIYEPGHHSDEAFILAIRRGSRQYHWSFGDMPPVEGDADSDIPPIILYVRELQRANGIH